MSDFTDLRVWEMAHGPALNVYEVSTCLPKAETYGLQAQMRRAAVSIPSNIAERAGRATHRDFARFVSHAVGSANELDYELMLTRDLGYADVSVIENVRSTVGEVRRMLSALRKSLLGTE
jgi:four helix bundle protein